MNRKDEHVALANAFHKEQHNDFDDIQLVHHSLKGTDLAEVSIATQAGAFQLETPFYINAMTGGSEKTGEINRKLAIIAREVGIMMATGSNSAALKDEALWPTFRGVREENPDGILLANIGANLGLDNARSAVEHLQADGLQIHVNLPQELVMPEGDRDFSSWPQHIQEIVTGLEAPVIVKEVGFGMSRETIQQLLDLGVSYIDISGQGGTSFTQIENARRKKQELDYLANWGQSTVISLLEANEVAFPDSATLLASGGVRNAYDIFKALCLGAKAVGTSGTILHSLQTDGVEATINMLEQWKTQLKLLYALTGARTTADLTRKQLIVSGKAKAWCEARGIDVKKYALR